MCSLINHALGYTRSLVHSLLIALKNLHINSSRCNTVPFLPHPAFHIPLLSCYFNLAKATVGKPPDEYLCVEVFKKKKKIWISCHWFVVPLFLSGVCIPGWLLSCSDYSHGLQSIHWGSLFKMVLVSLLHYWNEILFPEAGVKQGAIATLKKGRLCAWMQM